MNPNQEKNYTTPNWWVFGLLAVLMVGSAVTGVTYWWRNHVAPELAMSAELPEQVLMAQMDIPTLGIEPVTVELTPTGTESTTANDEADMPSEQTQTDDASEPAEPTEAEGEQATEAEAFDELDYTVTPTAYAAYDTYETEPTTPLETVAEPVTTVPMGLPDLPATAYHPSDAYLFPLDIRPEFIAYREQLGNPYLMARLYVGGFSPWINANPRPGHRLGAHVNLLRENQNTVIFLADGALLAGYADDTFFLQHPVITLSHIYYQTSFEVFSFYVSHLRTALTTVNFADPVHWAGAVSAFQTASHYHTRVDVTPTDRILTLIAPTHTPGLYYIVQARGYRHISS